jgi:hypothetical protein
MHEYSNFTIERKKGYTMLRPLSIAVIAGTLLTFALVGGCARSSQPTPTGGEKGTKADRARKQAEGLALNVVNGVAKAQAKAVPELAKSSKGGGLGSLFTIISPRGISQVKSESPTPPAPTAQQPEAPAPLPQMSAVKDPSRSKPPLRPGSPAIIWEPVISQYSYATEAEAEEDVLNVAQNTIEQRLAELDPPVRYRPSLNEIKTEFIRKDTRTTTKPTQEQIEEYKKNNISPNRTFVEYYVEVTADQIRELRTRDRITIAFRVLAGLTFIALSCFLFLRADEWTKGYLTRWLACAAVALVGGAAAALCFV